MQAIWTKRAAAALAGALVIAGVLWFAWPRPIAVDIAAVAKGPMEVTIDDEGKTRVRHVYTVSAPIAGKVLRISQPAGSHAISLHVGDRVIADETVVAIMQPMSPSFIDVRSREELQAAVAAADAAVTFAEAEIRRIEAALQFSQDELKRALALSRTGTISLRALDKAKLDVATNEAGLASAKAQLGVRRSERASVAARLIDPSSVPATTNPTCCIQIRAPVSGRVLKIVQDSEAVVTAGAPLLQIGDPLDLEIVADLLSTDAVQITHGSLVQIDGWGGPPIQGRVTRVDPAGFLKVSALGIGEQRVRTTIDLAGASQLWSRLGHDYRVIVHVTVWKADDALTVPVGSLFRRGNDWAVFSVKAGRARTTLVRIGHRNAQLAEVELSRVSRRLVGLESGGEWLPSAVELRLGKIRAGLAQDLVGLAQLAVLPLQRLDALALVSGRAGPPALVALGLPDPVRQGLRCAADLGRNRGDRRPLGRVLRAVLQHHPHRALTHLGREPRGRLVIRHSSNLSRSGASDKPGAVQSPVWPFGR